MTKGHVATFSLLSYKVPRKIHASACSHIRALAQRIVALAVVLPLRGQILPQRYRVHVHTHMHTEPVCRPLIPLYLCVPHTVQERGAWKDGHVQYYRG